MGAGDHADGAATFRPGKVVIGIAVGGGVDFLAVIERAAGLHDFLFVYRFLLP